MTQGAVVFPLDMLSDKITEVERCVATNRSLTPVSHSSQVVARLRLKMLRLPAVLRDQYFNFCLFMRLRYLNIITFFSSLVTPYKSQNNDF